MEKTESQIEQEVLQLVATALKKEPAEIQKTDNINDLSHDSIQLFELLVAFEKFYNTEASYEEVMGLDTVNDIINYVRKSIYKIEA